MLVLAAIITTLAIDDAKLTKKAHNMHDMLTVPYFSSRDGGFVKRAERVRAVQYRFQTSSTEEMSTLGLHWVPHGGETDGTLVPLQKLCHKLYCVPRHMAYWLGKSLCGRRLFELYGFAVV